MVEYMLTWLALRLDRRGVTAMEYGLIASLVAVVIIASLNLVGAQLIAKFTAIATALT
jgi:pilus assembly protein Flp/PilA